MENRETTNADLIKLYSGLKEVGNLKGVNFAYLVSKNKKLLEEEIKNIQSGIEMTDSFKLFNKKREEVCEKYALRTENGEVRYKTVGDVEEYWIDPEKEKDYNSGIEEYKRRFKSHIEHREEQIKEYKELLKKPSKDVNLVEITKEDLPRDITSNQLDRIWLLVTDKVNELAEV